MGMRYESALAENLEVFLRRWGPISWRDRIDQVASADDPRLGRLLLGLSGIEDDAFYMQTKLRASGTVALDPVRQFNAVWLVEEADHGRALAAIAARYGTDTHALRASHGLLHRDRRSIVTFPVMKVLSTYSRGMLAAYLVYGSLVEYVAITTYNGIASSVGDPIVKDILTQMAAQEGRHMRFYRRGAMEVMAGDRRCQRFVRYVIQHFWRPPGVDLYGTAQWIDIFEPILTDGVICSTLRRMDEVCSAFPGLQGTNVMGPFLDRCAAVLASRGQAEGLSPVRYSGAPA